VKTNLTARNIELGDRLRNRIQRKLQRLDRIVHPDAVASVELIVNASHSADSSQVAEVTLENNGTVLRSSASGATLIAALDIVLDKLERQLVRTKERPRSVRERRHEETVSVLEREATKTVEPGAFSEDEESPDGTPRVVRIKRFDMQPMFEEDAIAQMEELGHAFFVFHDAETDAISVIYRRTDGNYGLIQPVLGRSGR
jgi:putative sigma-54 modulation protein